MKKKITPKKKVSFQQHFAELLKLPQDLVYKDAVVTLLGSRQLRIENYQKLLEYQTDKIVVGVQPCKLVITGTNMEIVCYTNDEMYISGNIVSVSYAR